MSISKEEFAQWVNDPTTCYIRNKLIEQRDQYVCLDDSPAEDIVNVHKPNMTMEDVGLACAIRMAVAKGVELFTNTNELEEHIFGDDYED